MSRTLQDWKVIVKHTLGGDPPALFPATSPTADATKAYIVNRALQFMVGMHPWAWRTRGPTTFGFTASQSYIDLPSDFGELTEPVATYGFNRWFIPVSLSELQRIRSVAVTAVDGSYWYALSYPTQTSTTVNAGNPVMQIHPTPGSTESNVGSYIYRILIPEMSTDANVPNTPVWLDTLLESCIRAYAKKFALDDESAIGRLYTSAEFLEAKQQDARSQANVGQMTGGILQWSTPRVYKPWQGTIPNPS